MSFRLHVDAVVPAVYERLFTMLDLVLARTQEVARVDGGPARLCRLIAHELRALDDAESGDHDVVAPSRSAEPSDHGTDR